MEQKLPVVGPLSRRPYNDAESLPEIVELGPLPRHRYGEPLRIGERESFREDPRRQFSVVEVAGWSLSQTTYLGFWVFGHVEKNFVHRRAIRVVHILKAGSQADSFASDGRDLS